MNFRVRIVMGPLSAIPVKKHRNEPRQWRLSPGDEGLPSRLLLLGPPVPRVQHGSPQTGHHEVYNTCMQGEGRS
jgi:hypothetical protein